MKRIKNTKIFEILRGKRGVSSLALSGKIDILTRAEDSVIDSINVVPLSLVLGIINTRRRGIEALC
ncbi:hypothetical protein WN51_10291 [Melipona quadrifasciata]|uniref:Uncharacterized protein n=1 Tax=Melipona quadrifasciata TaxID=166423 RepID=A0A0N0U6L2_9HYME|nr:hypothetical protein WN51_10291 [Melipona quadrifasciata]